MHLPLKLCEMYHLRWTLQEIEDCQKLKICNVEMDLQTTKWEGGGHLILLFHFVLSCVIYSFFDVLM